MEPRRPKANSRDRLLLLATRHAPAWTALVLLSLGARSEVRRNDARAGSALHQAVYRPWSRHAVRAFVKSLSRHGCELALADGLGWTPLRHAIHHARLDWVEALLDQGVVPDRAAVCMAVESATRSPGHREAMRLVCQSIQDINGISRRNPPLGTVSSLLDIAVQNKDDAGVKALVDLGAIPTAETIQWASWLDCKKVWAALLSSCHDISQLLPSTHPWWREAAAATASRRVGAMDALMAPNPSLRRGRL